jgi:hypothetical protein
MSTKTRMLTALALAAIAIPAMAQEAKQPTKAEQDKIQAQTASEKRDTATPTPRTPEQVAADKATVERNNAKANQPAVTAQEKRIERTGNETRTTTGTETKRSPGQKARDKAAKAKKQPAATKEDLDKAKKVSPGL